MASGATVNDRDLTIEAIIRKGELCLRGPGLRIAGGKCQRGHWDKDRRLFLDSVPQALA